MRVINKTFFNTFLSNIQGAIILDTVFNYDPNVGSQHIPPEWAPIGKSNYSSKFHN